jgi:tetratricopeptide (TPR) repeat protein
MKPLHLGLIFCLVLLLPLASCRGCSFFSSPQNEVIVKRVAKPVKPEFKSPILVYMEERKFIHQQSQKKEIADQRRSYTSPEDAKALAISLEGHLHSSLKTGAQFFIKGKFEEAATEFKRVLAQFPDDPHLQVIATKNVAISYKKMGKNKEFTENLDHYFELLRNLPEDEDDF